MVSFIFLILNLMSSKNSTSMVNHVLKALLKFYIDGAAVVQAVIPQESDNFEQYCRKDFAGYIQHRFQQQGLEAFYVYLKQSIKPRSKRGQGKWTKVVKGTPLPRNWKSFLCVDGNKMELFHLLVEELVTETGFKELVITRGNLGL